MYVVLTTPSIIYDIAHSVGLGCKNRPLDVLVIQRLLVGTQEVYTGQLALVPDGFYGPNTQAQIQLFQQHVLKHKVPDKKISPLGQTHKKLRQSVKPSYVAEHKKDAYFNQKAIINIPHFAKLYGKQYPNTVDLIPLERVAQACYSDPHIHDVRWIAYMLATVKRECGNTWKPIAEWGKGKGKSYGNAIAVTDPVTGQTHSNTYYGRGYVQLTCENNYKTVGHSLGLGDELHVSPDKALEHATAYKIMSLGMRKGLFARASLGQFINGSRSDYVGARYIINGQDHAQNIANDALTIERLLKASKITCY